MNVDKYIKSFPKETQRYLQQIRETIKKAAPDAEEKIAYAMPAYDLHGPLVYFAGYKNHIGFYAIPTAHEAFKKDLAGYKNAKGSVQFPLDKSLPIGLISRMVKFRVKENIEKEKAKSLRICPKGHKYFKSSDCPTCPICEKERKPKEGLLAGLAAPARRALENHGIKSVKQLSKLREEEVLAFHGMGKSSIPKLKKELAKEGLSFKK